jgi:hypothetical protein
LVNPDIARKSASRVGMSSGMAETVGAFIAVSASTTSGILEGQRR